VAEWADVLEVRDDVGFDSAYRGRLSEVIFELANPDLCGAITPQILAELRTELIHPATLQGVAADAVRAACASRPVPAVGGILRERGAAERQAVRPHGRDTDDTRVVR
jgi:hypothetical protein